MTFSKLLTGFTALVVLSSACVSIAAQANADRRPAGQLSDKQRKIRLHHAHELLGRFYKKSSVNVGESIPKINSAVYHWTKDHLPTKFKDQSGKIAQTIIDVSTKQQFDPVFLMSVIEGESSWRPEKVGGVGEIGLMQLRPGTGKWMAQRAGVKWEGDKTLYDPCSNIKIGAAYLGYLRDRFDDHARLYLAAYNMGQTNVDTALDKKIWPKDYPIHIMKRYVGFYEAVGPTLHTKLAALKVTIAKNSSKASSAAASTVATLKAKSIDKMHIVVKYTPSKKKSKASEDSSDDDDTYFDIDKLTHPDGDLNSQGDENVDAGTDSEPTPEQATTAAVGAESKRHALPNRS